MVLTDVASFTHVVLTDCEQEVYRLVAQGLINRQIGERLYISRGTVKTDVAPIKEKEKLHMTTRADFITSYHRAVHLTTRWPTPPEKGVGRMTWVAKGERKVARSLARWGTDTWPPLLPC